MQDKIIIKHPSKQAKQILATILGADKAEEFVDYCLPDNNGGHTPDFHAVLALAKMFEPGSKTLLLPDFEKSELLLLLWNQRHDCNRDFETIFLSEEQITEFREQFNNYFDQLLFETGEFCFSYHNQYDIE